MLEIPASDLLKKKPNCHCLATLKILPILAGQTTFVSYSPKIHSNIFVIKLILSVRLYMIDEAKIIAVYHLVNFIFSAMHQR